VLVGPATVSWPNDVRHQVVAARLRPRRRSEAQRRCNSSSGGQATARDAVRPTVDVDKEADMPTLDNPDRDRLRETSFAWIDKQGERHLPINDARHVRNALARFNQVMFDVPGARASAARKILAAARRHGIDVDPEDDVVKSAHR
jgi:uncharacterized protein DUF6582